MNSFYFGAGCFWCVEAVFERLKGVTDVTSGYMGGNIKNPSYREVCNGTTGHAEVVKITYDPDIISVDDLLKVFWTTHNPTTLNRQGADRGRQYRSSIFFTSEEQNAAATQSLNNFAPTVWSDPIITEILPATDFYIAEEYHQDFYRLNPDQAYCSIVIPPKISKLKKSFAHLLKS